jgi:hypothetical protein
MTYMKQGRISVPHRRTTGGDGHRASLVAAAGGEREFREGEGEGERAHAAV